ncbi:hypothetical protein [Streptomyces sp. enrichment culture]|uniref:hypothetical protein n=1 Tax=Streptomyces sp. enrichment culture TaxID=1795815 RepID=UPI003F54FB7A
MARENASTGLPQPLRAGASVLRRVPGAGTVGHAATGALNAVGAVSPRGRRMAAYTGAGILGATGVVGWPVAVAGAAAVWLTQPRPGDRQGTPGGAPATGASTGSAHRSTSRSRHSTSAAAHAKGTSTRFEGPRSRSAGGTASRSRTDGTRSDED